MSSSNELFAARLGRPIPRPRPVRPFTRQSSLEELRATRTGRLLYATLWRMAPFDKETRADEAAMRTYKRALDELPLRGAAIYSSGKLRWATVDTLLDLLNGERRPAVTRLTTLLARSVRRAMARGSS